MTSSASHKGTVAVKPGRLTVDSGVFRTSPGLLRRRAVAPFAEGISQYLAIRLASAERGRRAYRALLRMLDALPPEELVRPPGPRAQVYRLARSIVDSQKAMPGSLRPEPLPWRTPSDSDGELAQRLRAQLSSEDAELIELAHARELSVAEIAWVLELERDEVELRLDTAQARARRILGRRAPDPTSPRATLYVEAFALTGSWSEDGPPPVDEDLELEPGTLIGGRYEIVERVGVGAFGDVYRAEDIEVPGHQVALKILRQPSLSESSRQSALRELKLNAAVFHPSLVQFKDHGWFEQRLWFVMPWYEGETLEERIRRGPLSRVEARRIFEPLARALAALHESGIRHQDIKPDNVLLTRLPGYGPDEAGGILPVLIDLGVAAEEQETMLGGTPLYFAPEVARRFVAEGHAGPAVDASADVFALALSLRNALEPRTQQDVPAGAVHAFVERRAREVPPLPQGRQLRFLRPALRRWMSLEPERRPSAEELAEELKILTAPEERRERLWKVARWLVPLLLTLAVAFVTVVHTLEQRAAREEQEARRARRAAAEARADLIVAGARQRSLEEGHAELLERYEQSRMSRRDLASQLATTEGQLRILRQELAGALEAEAQSGRQLEATRDQLQGQTEELAAARSRLEEVDARASRLAESLREAGEREQALRSRLEQALERGRDLTGQLQEAERGRQRQRRRAEELTTELSDARRARAHAERELEEVRGRIRDLAAALSPGAPANDDAASAPPAAGTDGPGTQGERAADAPSEPTGAAGSHDSDIAGGD